MHCSPWFLYRHIAFNFLLTFIRKPINAAALGFVALGILLPSLTTIAHAQDFISIDELKDLIIVEITKANEVLEQENLPRYKLALVELELSVSAEAGILGEIKIPILPVDAAIDGEYTKVQTKKDTYYLQPKESVPVGQLPDFGLQAFVLKLQSDLQSDLRREMPVYTARASREMTFVIRRKIGGGFSFFDLVSVGGEQTTANTHRIKFSYCLVTEENGRCVETNP